MGSIKDGIDMKRLSELKILVVDDEPFVRSALLEVLGRVGASILTTSSGCEAVDIIKNNSIDVVITDSDIIDDHGLPLHGFVQTLSFPRPAVVLMVSRSKHSAEDFTNYNALGILFKTFHEQSIIKLLQGIKAEVLVIEGEENSRRDLLHKLADCGYLPEGSRDKGEALQKLKDRRFDLVLLGESFYGDNCYSLLQDIRLIYSSIDLPIILLADDRQRNEAIKAFSAGVNDQLYRPYDFYDILSKIQAHLSLRHAEKRTEEVEITVQESDQAKSRFLASISHEIRTPLNGIIGMTSLLYTTKLTTEQLQFLDTIKSSGDSLLTIINDILDFSKIETGQIELQIASFDFENLMEGIIDLFGDTEPSTVAETAFYVDPKIPKNLMGDVARLRQIIGNLLGNAKKFTHKGYIVFMASLIKSENDTVLIRFSVKDTGIGIAQNDLSNLFVNDAAAKRGSTGFGLPICQQLCRLMNGHIWATSEENVGSTFYFELPFVVDKAESEAPLQDLKCPVLLISSSAVTTDVMKRWLEGVGCIVTVARSRDSALEIVQHEQFGLMVIDYKIGKLDGLDLGKAILRYKKNSLSKLVLMFPRFLTTSDISTVAKECGFADTIAKPIKLGQLRSLLEKATNTSRIRVGLERNETSLTEFKVAEKLLILVAEDNVANQLVIGKMINKLGHKSNTVSNGHEAIAAVRRKAYSMIFMDCQMPETDGLKATKEIRSMGGGKYKDLPIIAMTANVMKGDKERCLESGMNDYVPKPIKLDDIARTIKKWYRPVVEKVNATKYDKTNPSLEVSHLHVENFEFLLHLNIHKNPGFFEVQSALFLEHMRHEVTKIRRHIAEGRYDRCLANIDYIIESSVGMGTVYLHQIARALKNNSDGQSKPSIENYLDELEKELQYLEELFASKLAS